MLQVDERVRDAVRSATVKTDTIRMAVSDPRLAGKMKVEIDDPSQAVCWYIRFNVALDAESVNSKTMRVAETNGYILDTHISYNERDKSIILEPREMYEPNAFYILYISGKVKSARGNYLRQKVHILFKLADNRISEFKVLEKKEDIPKLKQKPARLKKARSNTKAFAAEEAVTQSVRTGVLPYAPLRVNVWLAVLGAIVMVLGVVLSNIFVAIGGVVMGLAGMAHIIMQMMQPRRRSDFAYNKGVRLFNSRKYMQARAMFQKALSINETNEYAEYALYKVQYFAI